MKRRYFKRLLVKYKQGKLTYEERQLLKGYYDLFQNEPNILDSFSPEEKEELKTELQNSIWSNILDKETHSGKVRFIVRGWVRVAAAVLVLVFSASLFYYFQKPTETSQPEVAVIQHYKENKVIFLPDGSKVVLSGDSKLNYPSTFEGMDKREVFLTGEAYFDIAHNEKMPFIVRTGKIETVVLGTAFNVKAYPDQETVTVTVTRGKVKVKDELKSKDLGILTPNQQIVYNTTKDISTQEDVDASEFLNWEQQDLICDNVTLAEAAQLLEARFHIKTIIKDPLIVSQRFTTTFSKDEKLENVLKSICVFNGLDYEFVGVDTVLIEKKK